MKLDTIAVGPLMTNCYLLADEEAHVCCVIDPGDEPERIEQMILHSGCQLQYVLLTHGHYDHFTGLAGLLENHPGLPVYIHPADISDDGRADLAFPRLPEENQRYYQEGDTLTLGNLTISVLETPGHTQGSVCLMVEDVIFAGDTLFRCSCGRTDFPGGSLRSMFRSLARLARLEGNYTVYPGHEMPTDLDYERQANTFMKRGLTLDL
ncbi:MAG: MBL fold metallo-hydrolase [Ruminococcaceae bacterium]|nr:MBL fold metallo-hydrolase [Oscillospiraceae bacterium]